MNKNRRALCDIFHFLRLTLPDGRLLPSVLPLFDANTRSRALAGVLSVAYPFVRPEELSKATMDRLKKLFPEHTGGSAMSRKALLFYLKAAVTANLALHPRLEPRARKIPRKSSSEIISRPVDHPVRDEYILETLELEGGGALTVKIEGQEFRSLSEAELKLATAAALVIQNGRAAARNAFVARRQPGTAKTLKPRHGRDATG